MLDTAGLLTFVVSDSRIIIGSFITYGGLSLNQQTQILLRNSPNPRSEVKMNNAKHQSWEDGWVAVVKEDCPTCVLVEPVLKALRERDPEFAILVQDNPDFPDLDNIVHDDELRYSYELNIETVPTLIKMSHGEEVERAVGWNQADWENLTGVQGLGADLPVSRPGCGSLSVGPGTRFPEGSRLLHSR